MKTSPYVRHGIGALRRVWPYLLFAMMLAGGGRARSADTSPWPPQVGQRYPEVEMTDQTGKVIRLSDFKGRIIVMEPISMDCTACQAWSGAHRVGAFGPVRPQADLIELKEMFDRFAGVSFDDPRFVFVQLLYFDLKRQPTQAQHAREWAQHFGFDRSKNRLVLAGSARYRTPKYDAGTYRQVPGLQLIDEKFILRSDATGHPPRDDIYRTTLPMIGRYVRAVKGKGSSHND
jgi:hypothetical protein